MANKKIAENRLDHFTRELLDDLFAPSDSNQSCPPDLAREINDLLRQSEDTQMTAPIVALFTRLKEIRNTWGILPDALDISRDTLILLSEKHQNLDEHEVSIGGRVNMALPIVDQANLRVEEYLRKKDVEAPSGIELWDTIQENARRIKLALNITNEEWNS